MHFVSSEACWYTYGTTIGTNLAHFLTMPVTQMFLFSKSTHVELLRLTHTHAHTAGIQSWLIKTIKVAQSTTIQPIWLWQLMQWIDFFSPVLTGWPRTTTCTILTWVNYKNHYGLVPTLQADVRANPIETCTFLFAVDLSRRTAKPVNVFVSPKRRRCSVPRTMVLESWAKEEEISQQTAFSPNYLLFHSMWLLTDTSPWPDSDR